MAQWNKNTQDYLNQERTLHEVYMCADRYGNIGNCGVSTGVNAGGHDAFGRSRVSETYTLADYSHQYGGDPEFIVKTIGAGSTISENTNEASVGLIVGVGSTSKVIYQSRMYHHYMPGKSQFAMISFNFVNVRSNTTKKVGYFDDRDGVFLQQSGDGTVSVVKRSFVTGVAVDTVVNQTSWSLDSLDGSGLTGITADFTHTQLFVVDFQWLGVGRIRCGLVIGGSIVYFHEFNHSNIEERVYWSHASLPIRTEVANTDTAVGVTSMQSICSTVLSEGGYSETGYQFTGITTSIAFASKPNSGYQKCVIAIRTKNTFNGYPNRTSVRISDVQILSSGTNCAIEVWRLPGSENITNGTWISADDTSAVEYNISAGIGFTTLKGIRKSINLVAANNPSGQQASNTTTFDPTTTKSSYISQNIDANNSNVWAVIVENLDTNTTTNVTGSLLWRETR